MESDAAAMAPADLGQPPASMAVDSAPELPPVGAASDDNGPGGVEAFFDSMPPERQMPYILFMATDCIEGFSVNDVHPYSAFLADRQLGGGGWMRKIKPTKDLVVQELKRRNPRARPNKSNKGVDEIAQLLNPLTDPRDVAFVAKKEAEFRQQMTKVLEDYEIERKEKSGGGELSGDNPAKRRRGGQIGPRLGGNIEGGGKHLQSNGSLTYQAADIIMTAAEQAASSGEFAVSIAIVDAQGNPVIVKRMQDASPVSFDVAVAKAKASATSGKNTGQIGETQDVARGGVAIIIDGVCCGGIGVSGTVGDGKSRHFGQIAQRGIHALKKASASATGASLDPDDGLLAV